ncbi:MULTISPECIES: hypothetical protein [Pseudomonas syringae group]|uniref:Prophage PssSM-02 n=2 Tax=Pseudomonas syringae group TaxID=136849 RepID=A0AAW4E190_PSESX|nr:MULTISPECIES: hypothetical protein [Pseudomonas syringae group]EEB56868.1 hypothetical protein PSPTOT1_0788 [Pseudomonas syringae pv. tomato T1]KGK92328.1 hypothetical protein NB04_27115 [Pseudomonas syringae pv. tomato]KUR44876.1 hypothetical protein PST407_04017 [Pseudomonas syringae pv. tomato]KUR47093.1 hypothetical protein PSTA9_01820 [Pseudomonas syringae pv. tomato]MBI6701056.1 hypothetical protein [Pseudomonas syringae]
MKPTDTAEFIGELNAGVFADQIGHALSEVAAGVVDNKKVGTVTLTFSLKQIADSHQVTVNHKLAYKVPTKRGSRKQVVAQEVGESTDLAIGNFTLA